MANMREIDMNDWQAWRCTTDSCPEEFVHVRRRSGGEDVWLFYERPGWVMAATVPVCPTCGMTLATEPVIASRRAGRA